MAELTGPLGSSHSAASQSFEQGSMGSKAVSVPLAFFGVGIWWCQ